MSEKDNRRLDKFKRVANHFSKDKKKARTAADQEFVKEVEAEREKNDDEDSDEKEEEEKAEKEDSKRQTLLNALGDRLKALQNACPQSQWVFDCNDNSLTSEKLASYRNVLQNVSGVVVVLNSVSRSEMDEIKKHIGNCMIEMYGKKNNWDQDIVDAVKSGDLYAANCLRNSKNDFGNVSFAYLYKQYTEQNVTPNAVIGGERVYFAHLPIHHEVLMRLMCANSPRRTAVLIALSSTPQKTMISWDSVKVAGGETAKKMTTQERTIEHIDEYGKRFGDRTQRIQAIINEDLDEGKLCFVPFTHDEQVRQLICQLLEKPDFFAQHGFKRISGDKAHDLIQVLDEFAVAPPPYAMVLWQTGVVHYEAATQPPSEGEILARFHLRKLRPTNRRLRFVMGTHTPTLSNPVLQRLAVACVRGVVPDYNRHINRFSAPKVYENIMNSKTTQFLNPRTIGEEEMVVMRHAISEDGVDADWNHLSPLYKHLYGVSQPFDSLGFSQQDSLLLPLASPPSALTTAASSTLPLSAAMHFDK